jgi:hypothetical protein
MGILENQCKLSKTPVQADEAILRDATRLSENLVTVTVLSSDLDYLGLCYPGSIHRLVDEGRQGANFQVTYNQVLVSLGEPLQRRPGFLSVAYALAGCHDISTKFNGIGWKTSLSLVSQSATFEDLLDRVKTEPCWQKKMTRQAASEKVHAFQKEYEALVSGKTSFRRSTIFKKKLSHE